MNTASMLHGMTAANVEKEVEDDEPDSQNDLKKSKTLIYLTKLKRIEKRKITSKNTSEDSEISEESSTEEKKETLGEDEEKTSNQKKEIKIRNIQKNI